MKNLYKKPSKAFLLILNLICSLSVSIGIITLLGVFTRQLLGFLGNLVATPFRTLADILFVFLLSILYIFPFNILVLSFLIFLIFLFTVQRKKYAVQVFLLLILISVIIVFLLSFSQGFYLKGISPSPNLISR